MSVGEKSIDAQHQRLLTQVNNVIKAITFGIDSDEVASAMDFFDKYINEHFTYEEVYMLKVGYPGLAMHTKIHHQFVENYNNFKKKFDSGVSKEEIILEIERYLGQWWIEHIGQEDKKYYLFAKK